MRGRLLSYHSSGQAAIFAAMDNWIHIKEVLADMETVAQQGKPHTFSLAFVRARDGRGGPRGSIKRVPIASKYTKPQRKASAEPSWQFKDHDAIPIQDLKHDQLLTPKYTHIIEYNGQPVKHYG